MKNNIFILILVFTIIGIFQNKAQAQTVSGHVYSVSGKEKMPLAGATVYWQDQKGIKHGTTTGAKGEFSISAPLHSYLVAAFMGFITDSLAVHDVSKKVTFTLLSDDNQLAQATIVARQQGTYFSKLTPQKTEMISKAGLEKMACCNLSESFENSATVTVGFTDAVSGAKQVQLLGLSGIYSQMLAENIPTLRGLASTYGWSYTPGPWLESIQISKGASSVVSGYESVSGQINLEFKKPNATDPLYINLFANNKSRYESNVTGAIPVSKKLWTGLLLHASTDSQEHDGNEDTFLDQPKTKLINIYNRWYYEDMERGVESRTGLKFLDESRKGGQHMGINNRYMSTIDNRNFNVYNKTGFRIGETAGSSLGVINSFTSHRQDSEFGLRTYKGNQLSFLSNVLFSSFINNTSHQYITGASFLYDKYNTTYQDRLPFNQTTGNTDAIIPLNREELVPGVFGQYTYSYLEKLSLMIGFRADYNSHYGTLLTPRVNAKYMFSDNIVARASVGRGYRAPNVISENIGLMASSRKLNVASIDQLDIEKAWNYGINTTFYIPVWDARKLTLSFDYFHTAFDNQAIVDVERNSNEVYFYNLKGQSTANAWQTDVAVTLFEGFDFFGAFRYNYTQMTLTDGVSQYLVEKPLTSRYRALVNLSYATRFQKWKFDFTAQVNGPSRLPSLTGYAGESTYSQVFPVYFAQITKNTKRFDVYVGVENIANFTQDHPILNADNPFGQGFDSSRIWGPLMGRSFYAGLRWRIG